MTLSDEARKEVWRMFMRWVLIPLVVIGASVVLALGQLIDISHNIERDTLRGELSDIDHRIKQERCVIDPINQVIRQRIEDRADSPRFRLCDPDEALPDLMARRDRLDRRLREMGAYEVRDE